MAAMDPILPGYDIETWNRASWAERTKMACQDWVVRGYGNPFGVYFFYPIKLFVFWFMPGAWFCTFSPGIESMWKVGQWWSEPVAFQKALLWSIFFEVFGMGCASGPLSGPYTGEIASGEMAVSEMTARPAWPLPEVAA